jgi:hypothetical protein
MLRMKAKFALTLTSPPSEGTSVLAPLPLGKRVGGVAVQYEFAFNNPVERLLVTFAAPLIAYASPLNRNVMRRFLFEHLIPWSLNSNNVKSFAISNTVEQKI